MTFDPLSSEGILKALRTGKIVSFVALDCLGGKDTSIARYEASVAADYESYLKTRADFYAMETRWPLMRFWARRVK